MIIEIFIKFNTGEKTVQYPYRLTLNFAFRMKSHSYSKIGELQYPLFPTWLFPIKLQRKSERGKKCANLCNHALEGDVFVVYLILAFPPFFICRNQFKDQLIWFSRLKPNEQNSEIKRRRKENTFWVGEIGVFSNFSACHCRTTQSTIMNSGGLIVQPNRTQDFSRSQLWDSWSWRRWHS